MSLSFIKLDINIMNDSKIKLISKMPDGAKLFKLWIGILCLGMKSGRPGVLEIGDGLPFNDETLSIELDIELPVVRLGLDTFKKFNMIEIFDTGEIYLSNFEKHQQLDRIEHNNKMNRERVARHREKAKPVMLTAPLPNGNVTPTDLDLDKDLDKDKKKHKYGEYSHVLLTDTEYQKIQEKTGDVKKWIKTLDEGIETYKYKYNNHYLVILKWFRKDNKGKDGDRNPHVKSLTCPDCGKVITGPFCRKCGWIQE